MPKNKGKGGKSFKAGNDKGHQDNKREIIFANPEDGEEYAQIKRALGNLRLELQLAGGTTVIGAIPGRMVRKVWMGVGDVVIIAKREFNANDIVDVVHKFSPQEVRTLVKDNVIPRDFSSAEENGNRRDGDYEFVNDNEGGPEEEDAAEAINRNEVVMHDPLGALDDL